MEKDCNTLNSKLINFINVGLGLTTPMGGVLE